MEQLVLDRESMHCCGDMCNLTYHYTNGKCHCQCVFCSYIAECDIQLQYMTTQLTEIQQGGECSICLCNIDNGLKTQCGHNFHEKCIMESARYKYQCPLCRSQL